MMAVAQISYPFLVGGQRSDRWMWVAMINGEVYDYHHKNILKAKLEKDGHFWQVIRQHRDGTNSIIEEGP